MNKYKLRYEKVIIKSEFSLFKFEELDDVLKTLVSKAIDATDNSYSPYSNFKVGAALQLEDGTIVIGANQENAAFSVTMCAERSAIFNAQSNHPNLAITTIAIAAKMLTAWFILLFHHAVHAVR